MVGLTAFNATSKPMMTSVTALESATNSVAVQTVFIQNERSFNLGYNQATLVLADSVKYNKTATVGLMALCPFLHVIYCPLHNFCNANADVIKSQLGLQIAEVFKNGSALFKNSKAAKKSIKEYLIAQEAGLEDKLVADLCDVLTRTECTELGIPFANRADEEEDEKSDAANNDDVEFTDVVFLKKMNMKRSPFNYVHNKWKCIVFCVLWYALNLRHLISWCFSFFEMNKRNFFMKLKPESISHLVCIICFYFVLLRGYIIIILSFEKRSVIHHKAYDMIMNYIQSVSGFVVTKQSLRQRQDPASKQLVAQIETVSDSEGVRILDDMNKLKNEYAAALEKRFGETSETMKYWASCRYLDLAQSQHPETIREAFGFIKFGPSMYQNQTAEYRKFEKEYKHFISVLKPLYDRISVENGEYAAIEWSDLETFSNELLVAKYKLDGDIIAFYWSSQYGVLKKFAIRALDNPPCNVDDERAMSALTWINDSNLVDSMEAPVMKARLMTIWNEKLFKAN